MFDGYRSVKELVGIIKDGFNIFDELKKLAETLPSSTTPPNDKIIDCLKQHLKKQSDGGYECMTIERNDSKAVETLIEAGLNIRTCLRLSAEKGNLKAVKALLKNAKGSDIVIALTSAMKHEKYEIIEALVKKAVEAEIKLDFYALDQYVRRTFSDKRQSSSILKTLHRGQESVTKKLIEAINNSDITEIDNIIKKGKI